MASNSGSRCSPNVSILCSALLVFRRGSNKQAFAAFEPAFSDSRNADSLKHLVSALIHGETQWTVSGLSPGIPRPGGNAKSRRAYVYFFSGADWSTTDLVQYHAKYVFDHLQIDDVYVPYRARMYVPEDFAPNFDEPFKKKTEIAVEDIVTPLQLPAGAALIVVFDSAYYGGERAATIRSQAHDVVCRLKSDKHVSPQGVVWTQRVDAGVRIDDDHSSWEGENLRCRKRDRRNRRRRFGEDRREQDRGYDSVLLEYGLRPTSGRPAAEILELVEHRWNIGRYTKNRTRSSASSSTSWRENKR
jgi:hypothetical protein